MKKFLKKLFKNKLLVLLLILIIVFIIFCAKIILVFTESDEVAIYGSRLDAVEKIKVDAKDAQKKITERIGEDLVSCSVRVQGRIINVVLTYKDETSRDVAKWYGNNTVDEFFPEEVRNNYDFQYYLTKGGQAEDIGQFPIIGYKHHGATEVSWSRDR